MKRSWLAATLLTVGFAAIVLLWFGFGGDRVGHAHGNASSAVLLGDTAAAGAHPSGAPGPAVGPAGSAQGPIEDSAAGQVPAADGADGHAAHEAAAAMDAPSAAGPADPDAPAADRRQISLADAAGGGSAPTAAAAMVDRWLDADAAGVNEGTKQQATGVTLQAAPQVDPTEVLPAHGLTNGCVAGYGRGTACLPQTPPSHAGHGGTEDMSIYWTCTEARTLLPDGIVVDTPGTDPLGLDGNRDGTACGPGDR